MTIPNGEELNPLRGIHEYCEKKGYHAEGATIRVGEWPVQFIPVFSALTQDALENAETVEFEGVPIRVVRAGYLAVIALSTGRSKDHQRILSLLESGNTSRSELCALAEHYGLAATWEKFAKRFLNE